MTLRESDRIRWIDNIPFWGVHITAIVGVIVVGFSWAALAWCAATFFARMFGVTAGYHRYFSHRTYKMGRVMQFLMALLGTLALQKGVLWWAAHHRAHHKFSDEPEDIHSPRQRGIWWAHVGWILSDRYVETDWKRIQDLAKYPELRWLNRNHSLVAVLEAVAFFAIG